MAILCTYCGREVPPGSSVCSACGQSVAAASAPAFTPVNPVNPGGSVNPGYAAQGTPYAAASPPASFNGGGAVKIILVIVGVFVFIGIAIAAVIGIGVWRVSKAVHVDKKGEGFSVTSPNGTVSSFGGKSTLSESDLGVAVYPGATRGEGSMNIKTPSGSIVSATYLTSDSPSKVADFYKGKLGDDASTVDTGSSTMITSSADSNSKVMITITASDDKTKIMVMHTTKKP